MLKVSNPSVTSSRHGQNRKLSISLIVTKRNTFLVFIIRLQFFRTGALHLLILFSNSRQRVPIYFLHFLTTSKLSAMSPDSRSEFFRFYSCHFKVKIFQWLRTKYLLDKQSYLRLLMSTLCSPWPRLLFSESLILIRYETLLRNIRRARSIFMFMCLIIDSRESLITDSNQSSLQRKICIWSDQDPPLNYNLYIPDRRTGKNNMMRK